MHGNRTRHRQTLAILSLAFALLIPWPASVRVAAAAVPADGTWAPLSAFNDPSPRAGPSAVWTGTTMLVWGGGLGPTGPLGTGAAYTPADDSWHALPLAGAPSPRSYQSAVWTGQEMLIWGGENGVGLLNDGAVYNPTTRRWRTLSTKGAPSPRAGQSAVWTGKRMLIWGGDGPLSRGEFAYLGDGAAYDPATDSWSPLPIAGAPSARDGASAVWTGRALLIWGGYDALQPLRDGAAYHPDTNSWTPIATSGAPSTRSNQAAVWTGTDLLIWGGIGCQGGFCGDGAAHNPLTDTWHPIPLAGAPSPRFGASAVWTGQEMLIWGGSRYAGRQSTLLGDGAAYAPATDTWRLLPATGAPDARAQQTAVWTGRAMLVWGGHGNAGKVGDGAAYTPAAGPEPHDQRYFAQTGYRVSDDAIWNYFSHRGGVRSFGYPTSRTVVFQGHTSQFFQRDVLQAYADGSVHPLNLLDAAGPPGGPQYGILPYRSFNFSLFPPADPAMLAGAPNLYTNRDYAAAIVAFVRANAPDVWNGLPVRFYQTFVNAVTLQDAYPNGDGNSALLPLLNLEIWGVPISPPAYDPSNHAFVYQRFQRGIMHFDAGCACTQGILMGDYLKAIITGQGLPADLVQEAAKSPFFRLYDPGRPRWVRNPNALEYTDLTNAFVPA